MLRIALLFFTVSFLACNSSENQEIDHMVFGIFFGECGGNCASFFKYTDNKIFQDKDYDSHYTNEEPTFEEENIAGPVELEKARSLKDNVPQFILESDEVSFGCPDCGDWGGIYLEIKTGEELQAWTLDNMNGNNPEEIRDFVEELRNLITELAN